MRIDVALSIDDNYSKYCATTMCSVIANKADDDEIYFHILHGNVCEDNINKLKAFPNTTLYKLDENDFAPYVRREKYVGFTPMFYRLKLASILPDIKQIIYLDCDIIVKKSLAELASIDISNYALAGVPYPKNQNEPNFVRLGIKMIENGFYFNSGVVFMNLEKIRNENIEDDFFNFLKVNSQNIEFADQDTLNATLQGKCLALPKKFNFVPSPKLHTKKYIKTLSDDTVILHFAGAKPWGKGFYNPFTEEFWKHYKNSGFISDAEYSKQYSQYKKTRNKFCQIGLYISRYPLAIFRPSKIKNLFEVLFS